MVQKMTREAIRYNITLPKCAIAQAPSNIPIANPIDLDAANTPCAKFCKDVGARQLKKKIPANCALKLLVNNLKNQLEHSPEQ